MHSSVHYGIAVGLLVLLAGCSSNDRDREPDFALPPPEGSVLPYAVLKTLDNGTEIRLGGYGSAMTAHPTLPGHFYALTDRGPNTDYVGEAGPGKKFPVATYTPRIGLFRLTAEGDVELVQDILLKDPDGRPITGLPNADFGATGEVPYDEDGNLLDYDPYGLDGEGLVALADGTFWVSDEYGPHIVHFDADGREMGRINPFADDDRNIRTLPPELAKRRPNRGMEGLTILEDGRTLVGIMQSTMSNPTRAATTNRTLTRIVTIDLDDGGTQQFLYRQEADDLSNSEIVSLGGTRFLIVERDGGFAGNGTAVYKRLYLADIAGATNVDTSNAALVESSDRLSVDPVLGLMVDGNTLEATPWETLAALGIEPATKTLAYDALAAFGYVHDKMEGLWILDARTVGILNDDDFAVLPDDSGEVAQKTLADDRIDGGTLYVIELETPLF